MSDLPPRADIMRTGQHVCFRASGGYVLVGKDVSCTDWNRDLIGIAHKTANRDTQANCPTVAMNAGEFGRANNRTTMSSSSNTSIAKKARTKAEADFATWLMMAKLGGFDDLPSNAQGFLTNYRTRLEMISEAESTALAVREVYSAYYNEMGGVGAAPEPKARTPTTEGKVVRVQRQPKPQPASSAARNSTGPMIRKSLAALLIFASMVALIVTYRFLTQ